VLHRHTHISARYTYVYIHNTQHVLHRRGSYCRVVSHTLYFRQQHVALLLDFFRSISVSAPTSRANAITLLTKSMNTRHTHTHTIVTQRVANINTHSTDRASALIATQCMTTKRAQWRAEFGARVRCNALLGRFVMPRHQDVSDSSVKEVWTHALVRGRILHPAGNNSATGAE
jgi:hypothetical protein